MSPWPVLFSLLPHPRPLIIRRMPHVLGLYLTPNGFTIFTLTKKFLKIQKFKKKIHLVLIFFNY